MRALLACLLCGPVLGQSGTLDQVSPDTNASFNASGPGLVWQQQARVGIGGQLEGFSMTFTGSVGAYADLRLRVGDGWNTGPAAWVGSFTKTLSSTETPFFDVTAASISLAPGDTFVIEVEGNNTGLTARGSYENPAVNPPQYPEELYLGGPPCYADCGWRLAFQTWMLGGGGPNYCTSSSNSTGAPALMSSSGTTSVAANDLTLTAAPVPDQPGLFLQGLTQTSQPLGPGTLCVALPFNRLQFAFGTNNSMSFDVDYPALPSGYQIAAGSTWHFQCWYRDPTVGPGYNLSDGLTLTFVP